jgi:hypothetical protein
MISLFNAEAKLKNCQVDLERFRVLKHRLEILQNEINKTVQIHHALMTETKSDYVRRALKR